MNTCVRNIARITCPAFAEKPGLGCVCGSKVQYEVLSFMSVDSSFATATALCRLRVTAEADLGALGPGPRAIFKNLNIVPPPGWWRNAEPAAFCTSRSMLPE